MVARIQTFVCCGLSQHDSINGRCADCGRGFWETDESYRIAPSTPEQRIERLQQRCRELGRETADLEQDINTLKYAIAGGFAASVVVPWILHYLLK